MRELRFDRVGVAALFLLLLSPGVRAEEVEKKFRVSFAIGGYNTQDEVRSSAANRLIIVDDLQEPVGFFIDPRRDSAAIGDLKIEPAPRATLAASYAPNRFLVLEAAVGYQKSDVGDIEVQAQFLGIRLEQDEDVHFEVFRIPAGELTQIPIQLSAFARFRPKANMNPYIGGGLGYTIVGFDSSSELDQLSARMDAAEGGLARLPDAISGFTGPELPNTFSDLQGARVDARDTFAWHLGGGMEYTVRKNLAAFVDARYIFASRALHIGFNGTDALGSPVPNRTEDQNSVFATASYGPYFLPNSGLLDAGRLVPTATAPPNTDCDTDPNNCVFVFQPDGITDPGMYYAQGGTIKYGGISLQVGLRYTF